MVRTVTLCFLSLAVCTAQAGAASIKTHAIIKDKGLKVMQQTEKGTSIEKSGGDQKYRSENGRIVVTGWPVDPKLPSPGLSGWGTDKNDAANSPARHVKGIGTVKYFDLEGGFYAIVSDDGTTYEPTNLDDAFKVDGLRVNFFAQTQEDAVSIYQAGTIVKILKIGAEGSSAAPKGPVEGFWKEMSGITGAMREAMQAFRDEMRALPRPIDVAQFKEICGAMHEAILGFTQQIKSLVTRFHTGTADAKTPQVVGGTPQSCGYSWDAQRQGWLRPWDDSSFIPSTDKPEWEEYIPDGNDLIDD